MHSIHNLHLIEYIPIGCFQLATLRAGKAVTRSDTFQSSRNADKVVYLARVELENPGIEEIES